MNIIKDVMMALQLEKEAKLGKLEMENKRLKKELIDVYSRYSKVQRKHLKALDKISKYKNPESADFILKSIHILLND